MEEYFNNLFKNIDDNIFLDSEQRNVVLDESDNLMVVAGAGSGKTTTMSAKVKYLVDIKKVNPETIALISFTNKAVEELKMRINIQFKIPCKISTFHSLAFSILKDSGKSYKIESNPHRIVENFLKSHKKLVKTLKNPQYCMEIINLYKNNPIIFHNKNRFWKDFNTLYNYYKDYMKSNNLIDFEDIINECLFLLEKEKVPIKYKYIIVDEFQDISLNRYKLIELLSNLSQAKVIVVGDDWQAIFSFAGSDVNLFHKFSKKAKVLKITNTYRNSQELIDIAGDFVMKNDSQIKKALKSNKYLDKPIVIYACFNKNRALIKCLDTLVKQYGLKQRILLLGRFNFDIYKYLDNIILKKNGSKIIYEKYNNLDITFLTVHTSKGLGFDNVIILNASKGEYGFPSLKKADKFKSKLINNVENYLYAEERRLFYVALTRTKNKVLIIYKFKDKSVFLKELNKYKQIDTKIII